MATTTAKKLSISIPPEWSRVAQQFAKDVEAFTNQNAAAIASAPSSDSLAALQAEIAALQAETALLQAEIDALGTSSTNRAFAYFA